MKLAEKQLKIAFDQAQKEVDDLRQRTIEGLQTARLAGKTRSSTWSLYYRKGTEGKKYHHQAGQTLWRRSMSD